jgi:hypothetical protein
MSRKTRLHEEIIVNINDTHTKHNLDINKSSDHQYRTTMLNTI